MNTEINALEVATAALTNLFPLMQEAVGVIRGQEEEVPMLLFAEAKNGARDLLPLPPFLNNDHIATLLDDAVSNPAVAWAAVMEHTRYFKINEPSEDQLRAAKLLAKRELLFDQVHWSEQGFALSLRIRVGARLFSAVSRIDLTKAPGERLSKGELMELGKGEGLAQYATSRADAERVLEEMHAQLRQQQKEGGAG